MCITEAPPQQKDTQLSRGLCTGSSCGAASQVLPRSSRPWDQRPLPVQCNRKHASQSNSNSNSSRTSEVFDARAAAGAVLKAHSVPDLQDSRWTEP